MQHLIFITLSQFLHTLIAIGYLIAAVLMMMVLWRIFGWLYNKIILGFLAPFMGHRAYFYRYLSGGDFYSERFLRILFFFKLGRNKKWAIHKSLVGFVKKPFWSSSSKAKTVNIFSKAHGHSEHVAYAKFEHNTATNTKFADIIMIQYFADGSSKADNDNPVGYVDEHGDIYKYYENYDSYKRRIKLNNSVKIGTCANIIRKAKKKFDTDGSFEDAAVLKFIEIEDYELAAQRKENNERFDSLRDSWYSIRLNKPKKQKVKSILFDSTYRMNKRRWIDLLIWRFINVIPLSWNVKAKAFGYGFSKENFNWGKSTNIETETTKTDSDQKGIPLNYIGCAALLLLEEQGFLRYEDGIEKEEKLGWAETALISLLSYLLLYKFFTKISFLSFVFPFIGPELSTVLMMTLIFFGVWSVLHFIYNFVIDRNYHAKQFLNMVNANVGTLPYSIPIIPITVLGLVLTYFYMPYILLPFFISILIAVSVNMYRFPHRKWDIINPLDESENDNSHADNDTNDAVFVEKVYSWKIDNSFRNIDAIIKLRFIIDQIHELRKINPFSRQLSTSAYSSIAGGMVEDELSLQVDSKINITIVPSLNFIKNEFDKIAEYHKMTKFEKISMILYFVQQAIFYKSDNESEVLKSMNLPNEYCRFSRETLFDQEGDCDCKSELAATLLAKIGYKVGYFTTHDHAFIGISSNELFNLEGYFDDMYFEKDNMKFLFCETTSSGWTIGKKPEDFSPAQIADFYVIN